MKPRTDQLCVVTATTDLDRARECVNSWAQRAFYDFTGVLVISGMKDQVPSTGQAGKDGTVWGELQDWVPDVDHKDVDGNIVLMRRDMLGVVPAFALGLEYALKHAQAQVIALLHDDLLIEDEDSWDLRVLHTFENRPEVGLVGFGGGTGLGHQEIYQKGYSPYDLAREGFCSNMRDAEQHGRRERLPRRVACLDGFSQIGRRAFWEGWTANGLLKYQHENAPPDDRNRNLMRQMADWGLVHHAYDAALGAWAARLGWEVWMLPVACHHFGGRTAVGDPRYAEWAETVVPGGDRTFWELAHKEVYERFRDVLPVRV